MKRTLISQLKPVTPVEQPRLVVRTGVRAGIAWDDVDDAAISLWNQLSGAVSDAVTSISDSISSVTSST